METVVYAKPATGQGWPACRSALPARHRRAIRTLISRFLPLSAKRGNPHLNFQTDSHSFFDVLIEEIQYCRTALRVCNFSVLVQLDEGHPEEAMRTCLAMFRLTRLLDRDPMIISQLVSIAIRGVAAGDANLVLRSGPFSPAAHAALEQKLALFDAPERVRQSLRSEPRLWLAVVS